MSYDLFNMSYVNVIEGSSTLMSGSSSWYVNTLVAIDIVVVEI